MNSSSKFSVVGPTNQTQTPRLPDCHKSPDPQFPRFLNRSSCSLLGLVPRDQGPSGTFSLFGQLIVSVL